jgi:hypothetical protein
MHKNAKITPKMRPLIVERQQAGETPRSIVTTMRHEIYDAFRSIGTFEDKILMSATEDLAN